MPSRSARPSSSSRPGRGGGAGVEVLRFDQQTVVFVDDLVLYPADPTGDDRTRFPHRLGDGQPEPLDEALLHDEMGVALQRVDDDRVLVAVVHRNGREVDAPADLIGQVRPLCSALGEHGGALGVVGHRRDVRPGEHEVGVVGTVFCHRHERREDP